MRIEKNVQIIKETLEDYYILHEVTEGTMQYEK